MKTTIKNIILVLVLVLGYSAESEGQVTVNNAQKLNLEKIEPYKELCVTGLIFSYKGKPQMQIKSHNQISTL